MATHDFARHARHRRQRKRGKAATRPSQGQARGSGVSWGSFVSGMVVGIALALAGTMLPWRAPGDAPFDAASGAADPGVATPGVATGVATPETPEGTGGPRFTFWEELPRERSVAPVSGPEAAAPEPETAGEAVEYLLQAGSFARAGDAERLRSSLSDLGLAAETATVTLPGGATRHRVLVGPFTDRRELRRAQTRLREQDIDPLPLRRSPAS